uniref:Reverse transcriptase domain-containing protein n=1 Tax=Tanacetum cinerariifolium TaxID=118510 RepID=A0A6L2KV24_TANCI|nr:reverse transcriptase domain-containing protein [Tanacetum cinerariifolium]
MEQEIPRDEETFQTLRRINMKLNLKKCTFSAEEGMFMGHVVNMMGIKACPEKAEAVIKLQYPRTLKEVQSLNGKLASLNGSSCLEGLGAGLIPTNSKMVEFTYALRFEFNVSNNEAEYEALLAGLRIAEQMSVKNLEAKVDSRLVANQVNISYVAKEQSMIQYLERTKTLISGFKKFSIEQVSRSENKKADALSEIASTSFAHLTKQVLVEVLKEKLIKEKEILSAIEEEGDSWMTPLLEYLTNDTLPAEAKKARAVKISQDNTM